MGAHRISRRGFLTAAGGAAVGAVAGAGAVALADEGGEPAAPSAAAVAFHGEHQAGIVTPAQDRLMFAAFDLVDGVSQREVRELLAAWTTAAERMTRGAPVGPDLPAVAPPADTGEALGLPPSRLTVTFGFGPGFFAQPGLRTRRPARLRELPPLPGDELDPQRSGGDLCVQACADDPQVTFHAVRNLARIGRGVVVLRWSQLGFGRTSSTTRAQDTPRNLMGFKDGTNNITAEEPEALTRFVWAGPDEPAWMRGGTYLVARRIRILVEVWDRASLDDQEATIGRRRDSGAPLTGSRERDAVDLEAQGADGPLIPAGAHVRVAAPETHRGLRILRRGYSFTDGFDAELGQLDAGLFFVSFQRDPESFVRLQTRLGREDALNEYIKHVGSAVFAVPGGVAPGRPLADGVLG
jgi:deferrochelatase/peroxidase EfeB